MVNENGPSQREFDMLRDDVKQVRERINSIDDHGTRGVVGLTVQITELIREFGEFKLQVMTRFTTHDNQHEQDEKDRLAAVEKEREDRKRSRRWTATFIVSALVALSAVITLLVYIAATLH